MAESILAKTLLTIGIVGAECAVIGVFIFLLNIPFVGVAIAHSAMAGGIWGIIAGLPSKGSAFAASILASLFIGPVSDRARVSPNITLSIIFSLVMGLAFLGVGLMEGQGSLVMSFLWGNIFLVSGADITLMAGILCVLILIVVVFYRQFLVILLNREMADASGINAGFYYYLILILAGAVITVNLNTIGGLMLFALIIIPPAIAYQLTFDLRKFFVLSALSGVVGAVGGVLVSFALNWPVSATVVIFMSLLFLVVLAFSPKRRAYSES